MGRFLTQKLIRNWSQSKRFLAGMHKLWRLLFLTSWATSLLIFLLWSAIYTTKGSKSLLRWEHYFLTHSFLPHFWFLFWAKCLYRYPMYKAKILGKECILKSNTTYLKFIKYFKHFSMHVSPNNIFGKGGQQICFLRNLSFLRENVRSLMYEIKGWRQQEFQILFLVMNWSTAM